MFEAASAFPTIAVSDIDRAKKFYGEILGFKVTQETTGGVRYETGSGSPFFVYPSQFAATNKATYMAFEVQDVDAAVKELRERGIVFEEYDFPGLKTVDGIADIEGERGAWFKDPDGNILSVGQLT